MAINTAAKRRSAFNWGMQEGSYPLADGTVGEPDRKHLWGLYVGINSVAEPVLLHGGDIFTTARARILFSSARVSPLYTASSNRPGYSLSSDPALPVYVTPGKNQLYTAEEQQ